MSLFNGVENFTPAFTGRQLAQSSGRGMAQAFTSGYNARTNRQQVKQQGEQFDERMAEEKRRYDESIAALEGLTAYTQGGDVPADSIGRANHVISKLTADPRWLADPRTSAAANTLFAGASKILTLNMQMERLNNASLAEQSKLKDLTAYNKRLETILPEDRAMLRSLKPNEDGSVSRAQWEAIGLAEQTAALKKENERRAAEIDVLQSGMVPASTKIGDTTYRQPATNESLTAEPKTKMLENGMLLAWMPGGKGIHVIKGDDKQEMTPGQLMTFSKALKEENRKSVTAKQIDDFLSQSVSNQISGAKSPDLPTAEVAFKRVHVRGPNGERGTVVEGTPLAEGWSLE